MLTRNFRRAALLAPLLLCACIEPRAYLGADYERNLAQGPPPAAQPTPVRLVAEFRVNEELSPGATRALLRQLKRVLEDSGVYQPADDAGLLLRVAVDNRADLHQAAKSGFISGLTEGQSGEAIEDRYDFALSLEGPHGVLRSGHYQPVLTTFAVRQVPAEADRESRGA